MLRRYTPLRRFTPIRRRSRTNSRPGRDSKYLKWIRTLPCANCGLEYSVEAAHTRALGPRGMGRKAADRSAIPLCTVCHTGANDSYHQLTPEWRWADYYGIELRALVERLNNCFELIQEAQCKSAA